MISLILKRDCSYLLEHFKFYVIYSILLVSFVLLGKNLYYVDSSSFFLDCIGFSAKLYGNPLVLILFLFHFSIACYLAISLFVKDLTNGVDCLFLRVSPTKWLFSKEIVRLILLFLLKVIVYIVIILCFFLFGIDIPSFSLIFSCFLLDLIVYFFVQEICILFYIFNSKFSLIATILGILFFFFICLKVPIELMLYNNYKGIISLGSIFLEMVIFVFYKYYYVIVFEKVGR